MTALQKPMEFLLVSGPALRAPLCCSLRTSGEISWLHTGQGARPAKQAGLLIKQDWPMYHSASGGPARQITDAKVFIHCGALRRPKQQQRLMARRERCSHGSDRNQWRCSPAADEPQSDRRSIGSQSSSRRGFHPHLPYNMNKYQENGRVSCIEVSTGVQGVFRERTLHRPLPTAQTTQNSKKYNSSIY